MDRYSFEDLKKDVQFSKIFTSSNKNSEKKIEEVRKIFEDLNENSYFSYNVKIRHLCNQAIISDNCNASAYFILGLIDLNEDFLNSALNNFMIVGEIKYSFIDFFKNKILECTEAIEVDPMDPDAYLYCGMMNLVIKNLKSAIRNFETMAYGNCRTRSIFGSDNVLEVGYLLGVAYFESGNYEKAIKLLDRVIFDETDEEDYNPEDAEYYDDDEYPYYGENAIVYEYEYYLRGKCYEALNEYREAEKNFKRYNYIRKENNHSDMPDPSFGNERFLSFFD